MAEFNIIYTQTDEAPALATKSLLPILKAFSEPAGIKLITKDISLAGRILAIFPDYLEEGQRVEDALKELGELAKTPQANIVKLPNISASIPQLKATIKELQQKGYNLPNYPEEPSSEEEKEIKSRYDKVKGSAVNPVLREGNSDRRAPRAVKEYARKHPHSMGEWSSDSKSHVASMKEGDFFESEKSYTLAKNTTVDIVLETESGEKKVLKKGLELQTAEVIDAAVMSKNALVSFLEEQYLDAKSKGVLFSVHLKATMMKVSDPIIFGHVVEVFYKNVFEKFSDKLKAVGADPRNGMGNILNAVQDLNDEDQRAIEAAFKEAYEKGPDLAMVNSDKGISNLHVPSDVIIDASMPAMIRTSGKMWNKEGKPQDTKAIIPDRSYSGVYKETIDFCKKHGAFDPVTMGSVPNVGLMAQKAEEYGSHDKTFEISNAGHVKVIDASGKVIFDHQVEKGDIWRMCQTKDAAIRDWVKLAVNRAKSSGTPAVFWLDENRAHDLELIKKVKLYLQDHNTSGVDLKIMSPIEATRYSLERMKAGEDTISVTGNVLRDYLTDLFPILEVGTSAKMLSIVPLMKGGGLFETGAGGSAPKHVQQFVTENHLRWDSLGEFLAMSASFEHFSKVTGNEKAAIIADALDTATGKFLDENKSPSRKVNELDNRGSHFYLAMYWAEALSNQGDDLELKEFFKWVHESFVKNEDQIIKELLAVQGKAVDLEGYYLPNEKKASEAMRPSETLNNLLLELKTRA